MTFEVFNLQLLVILRQLRAKFVNSLKKQTKKKYEEFLIDNDQLLERLVTN